MLTFQQIKLLYDNSPLTPLRNYTNREDFFLFFIRHLKEYFSSNGDSFDVLDPLLECDKGKSQMTTFAINGKECGQFFYLIDEYSLEATLFFFNKEHKYKHIFFEEQMVEEILPQSYFHWLSSLRAICLSFEN